MPNNPGIRKGNLYELIGFANLRFISSWGICAMPVSNLPDHKNMPLLKIFQLFELFHQK